ncbi:MAG: hypothetical protein IJF19_03505 [Clostridia bacterium]|nr:hypothetical protein [Clostridia bacterium]
MKNFAGRCWMILLIVLMLTALLGLGGCAGSFNKTVTSIEAMRLTTNSYHEGGTAYEIAVMDEKIELKYYRDEYYEDNGFVSELKVIAVCDSEDFIELMNNCKVMSWDGFLGTHPVDVLDGASFGFTATVNGGQEINASGSSNYPKGYGEFITGLHKILNDVGETVVVEETVAVEEAIASVDFMVLSLGWYDGGAEFDIDNTGSEIEIKYYEDKFYEGKGFVTEHLKTLICDTEEFIDLMNQCKVMSWNGFYSESTAEGDGSNIYEVTAIVNDVEIINAYGVDSAPEGYENFYRELYRMIDDVEEIVPSIDTLSPEDTVTSVEYLKLSFGGGYGTGGRKWYEVTNTYGETEISYYEDVYYEDEGNVPELKKSAVCDTEELIELMNESRVMTWDGFIGYRPPGILDVGSFSFTACVNGGQEINARGTANYPIGYSKLYPGLVKMLNGEYETE